MPGKICAVINCSNSTAYLNRWKESMCYLHMCNSGTSRCVCEPPFTLFTFPTGRKDTEGRKRWVKQLNRKDQKTGKNWSPSQNDRVCSEHFVDKKPTKSNPDPTLKLGYETHVALKTPRREIRKHALPSNVATKIKITKSDCDEQLVKDTKPVEREHVAHAPDTTMSDHTYAGLCSCGPHCACSGCRVKQHQINRLQSTIDRNQLETKHKSVHTSVTKKVVQNDKKTKLYTGLPNKESFDRLYTHILPRAKKLTYWNGSAKCISTKVNRKFKTSPKKFGPKRKLSVKDEMTMTLMKLRLGVPSELLGDMFGVSLSVVSQVVNTWLKFLSRELKPLIFWPPKEIVQATLPAVYTTSAPNLRCIIDCTEIFIERPRDLDVQTQTWSDYKHNNTLKFLVGISPNGSITFLSEAYGGRASDKHIVHDSGFLELIDPTDEVMADRGFPIQSDLVMRQAKLIIPPPSQGAEQMTKNNVLKTKTVANLRIHVERAIGRIKWFQILKQTMPLTLVPLANEILIICAALSNLQPPLVC